MTIADEKAQEAATIEAVAHMSDRQKAQIALVMTTQINCIRGIVGMVVRMGRDTIGTGDLEALADDLESSPLWTVLPECA